MSLPFSHYHSDLNLRWFLEASETANNTVVGPQGFWGSGEKGYLFSGSWGALVIILGKQGSKLIFFWDLGSRAQK